MARTFGATRPGCQLRRVAGRKMGASGGFRRQAAVGGGSATVGTGPWTVVRAYYQDITLRDYAAAWQLLGYHPQGAGYASFVAGYAHTGRQTVRKISESGDHVSFTLRSDNPDGTVQTYQGTAVPRGGDALGLPFGAQLELVFGDGGQDGEHEPALLSVQVEVLGQRLDRHAAAAQLADGDQHMRG